MTDRFEVRLRVTPEPSLTLGKVGDVQGLEAVDDLGRSLVPESPVAEAESNQVGMMNGFRAYPDQNTALSIRLHYPDKPGSTIRRLKGTFAVTVVGTKSDAVSASLVSALNVPIHKEGVTLTIHGVTTPPAMPAVRLVELSMTRPETAGQSQNGMASFNRTVNVVPNSAQGWLQFVDAEGRQVERVAVTPFNIADGNHRSVQFNQLPGVGMAIEVRYLTPIWATLDVPFDFHDLPMP